MIIFKACKNLLNGYTLLIILSALVCVCACARMCTLSGLQLFATLWTSPLGSSVHGIFHAGILEWVAISSSRGFSQPRGRTFLRWQVDSLPLHHLGSILLSFRVLLQILLSFFEKERLSCTEKKNIRCGVQLSAREFDCKNKMLILHISY